MRKVSKFDIKDLMPIGITFVVFGIAIAFGLNVFGDVRTDLGTDSCADNTNGFTSYNSSSGLCYNSSLSTQSVPGADFNASVDGISGVSKLPEKLPLIATVVVAAVIIGILIRFLFVRFT